MNKNVQPFQIRPLGDVEGDRAWVAHFIAERWGADIVVAHGATYHPAAMPGFIAWRDKARIGLVTYQLDGKACEIVTLDSTRPGTGVGTALIHSVRQAAREAGCQRLWLITTNDNLEALGFYQKRGFQLVAVHRGAVERSRQIKPEIPLIGAYGIPLRDEIELEMLLE